VRFGILGSHPGAFVEPTCSYSPAPVADFQVEVHGPTVSVYATQPTPPGTQWRYRIDFGDGSNIPHSKAWHTYDAPGEYAITVTVTDGAQQSVSSQSVVVKEHSGGNHAPVARIWVDVPYGSSPNVSNGLSYDEDGDTLTQSWHHVRSGTSTWATSVLTVFDGELGDTTARSYPNGCNSSYHQYPTAAFTHRIEGMTLYVDARDSQGTSLEWSFGDGATSTSIITSHTYSEPGEYTISLRTYGYPHSDYTEATVVIPAQ
jgi:PKD repeat protein